MPSFRVIIGVSYGSPERHAEPGSIVSDLPPAAAALWVAEGVVEPVGAAEPGGNRNPSVLAASPTHPRWPGAS